MVSSRKNMRHKIVISGKCSRVVERETSHTSPKVLPTLREYTSLNCISCLHQFHYVDQYRVRQLTQSVFSTTCALSLSLHRQLPLTFFHSDLTKLRYQDAIRLELDRVSSNLTPNPIKYNWISFVIFC